MEMGAELRRSGGRHAHAVRPITIEPQVNVHAEGSALIGYGRTLVLCTATVEETVPDFCRETGEGWVTAEYNMLPRATSHRIRRAGIEGPVNGRSLEIQRLIGRSLRAVVNRKALGERTIILDCDVLQADGGTRTAAITGSSVALWLALHHLVQRNRILVHPMTGHVGAVSVGLYRNIPILDPDYEEDSNLSIDLTVVMNERFQLLEIQGAAEGAAFDRERLNSMLDLAQQGVPTVFSAQRDALATLLSSPPA
jgi:ribonuclease PH